MAAKIVINPKTLPLILFSFICAVISTARVHAQSPQVGEYICILNVDTVSQTGYTGPGISLPGEMKISFSDLNHDNIIDALITFSVDQCDESNRVKSVQRQLLVLSKGDSYYVDEKYFEKITSSLKKGWITVENAAYGRIYGSFHDFKNSDSHNSLISKNFSVVFPREKLEYSK